MHDVDKIDEVCKQVPATAVLDAKSIYDALTGNNQMEKLAEKRTALELLSYLQDSKSCGTVTRWVHGDANLADSMTKIGAARQLQLYLTSREWSIVFDEDQKSAKKRKALGLDRLNGDKLNVDNEATDTDS